MENHIPVIARSKTEKQQLIEQWRASGQNKKVFCEQNGITYHAFIGWTNPKKRKSKSAEDVLSSFVPLKIRKSSHEILPVSRQVFAEVFLNNNRRVLFHRAVSVDYLRRFIK